MFDIFGRFSFGSGSTTATPLQTPKVEPKLGSPEPKRSTDSKTPPNPINVRNPVEDQLRSLTDRLKRANEEIKCTQKASQVKFQHILGDLDQD